MDMSHVTPIIDAVKADRPRVPESRVRTMQRRLEKFRQEARYAEHNARLIEQRLLEMGFGSAA